MCFLIQNRDTLRLILHDDWCYLPQVNSSNLIINLNKATDNLKKSSSAYQLCQQLIQLIETAPWENTTLKKIVNGEQIDDDEGKFIESFNCDRIRNKFHSFFLSSSDILYRGERDVVKSTIGNPLCIHRLFRNGSKIGEDLTVYNQLGSASTAGFFSQIGFFHVHG